ncbi:MAG TPA: hypothetical protein VHN16_06930 [Streptosporangiaceae bacterium]|nr:hypothetical protein [Streptosporangiaceae bacterium]
MVERLLEPLHGDMGGGAGANRDRWWLRDRSIDFVRLPGVEIRPGSTALAVTQWGPLACERAITPPLPASYPIKIH